MLNKEQVIEIIKNSKSSYPQILKAHHKETYDVINKFYEDGRFSEKVYRWLNSDEIVGRCKECDSITKFMDIDNGYREFCSAKCANQSSASVRSITLKETNNRKHYEYYEKINCVVCGKEFEALKYREQKCCSGKCSGIYVSNIPNRMKKIKATKLERHGNEMYVNPDKARETCLKKYGVDNVFKFREMKDKIKIMNLKTYGVDWTFQSPIIKEKIKMTNLERYGVENPAQSSEIQERVKSTFNEHYGVDNVFKHKETMNDIYKSNILKYGSKIPVNGPTLKSQMLKTFRKTIFSSIISRLNEKCGDVIPLFTIDEYINTYRDNKYRFKCNKCNVEFEDNIDGGHLPRCLICNPFIAGFSLDEREISDYVKSIVGDVNVIENDRSILGGLELDIYVPTKNVAIEYNGLYWHSEHSGNKPKKYHKNKTELCEAKGIRLIQIFEDEWQQKKDIVKSKIKHILQDNLKEVAIYARKCIIKPIDDCKQLMTENHIQGNCPASIKLGAFYNDKLVAAMTFGNRRVAMGKKTSAVGEYELLRFATTKRVVGIASKLMSYFIKNYTPNKITTYADRRWSVGKLYENIGFTLVSKTEPNYYYFKVGETRRWHRFNFRKDQLPKRLSKFDINLTEWENMQLNGYDRIWDCGNMKFEWNKKTC